VTQLHKDYLNYINHRFISTFGTSSVTKYNCPYCKSGELVSNQDELHIEETPESRKERYDSDWEKEWTKYLFSGALTCKSCSEKIFCTGTGKLEFNSYCGIEEAPESINDCYEIELRPTYFEPAVYIFNIPSKCPQHLQNEIIHAFKLAFSDYSASGNRVRTCIELYIKELNPLAKGKLHKQIESIKNHDSSVYEILMAIKWLGNQGSHESNLQEYDLAFAFEALECCLKKQYESNEAKLKNFAVLINDKQRSIAKI
jgi:hypothetical protein